MSAGERAARDALHGSVQENAEQMRLAEESRVLLSGIVRGELRDELRLAVAEGLASFLNEDQIERFWRKGFEVAHKESKKRLREAAGDLVLGGLRGLLKWGSMVAVMVAFAFYVGGFDLARAMWAAITRG
jgi:hypothetical protein